MASLGKLMKNPDVFFFSILLQLKEEMELRKQLNLAELNELDEDIRVEVEGYRTGTYLRLEVHDVPYEMVEHFNPSHPIIVGGLGLGEESAGFMQVSLATVFGFFSWYHLGC